MQDEKSFVRSAFFPVAPFLVILLSQWAAAQSFNLDYGSGSPTPDAVYGGAAAQLGHWNNPPLSMVPQPLVDLSGASTNVTINMADINPSHWMDSVATTGDDENLLDDLLDLGALAAMDIFTISGLAPGAYGIYTYAWSPDSPAFRTGININGTGEQIVGGAWSGGHEHLVTYALHSVMLSPGEDLILTTRTVAGFGSLNGIQIVPEPGSALFAAIGLCLICGRRAARRRRRYA